MVFPGENKIFWLNQIGFYVQYNDYLATLKTSLSLLLGMAAVGRILSVTAGNRMSAKVFKVDKSTCNPNPTKPTDLRYIALLIYLA